MIDSFAKDSPQLQEVHRRSISSTSGLAIAALCGGIALVLPPLFHLLSVGHVFLPMFLPLLLAGFLASLKYAVPAAISAPIISAAITGMPPLFIPPVGLMMIVELSALVILNWFFYRRLGLNIFFAAILAVLVDRILYAGMVYAVSSLLHLPAVSFTLAGMLKTFPGVILLSTVVPLTANRLERYV